MKLTSSELRRLAESLSSTQLRLVLSGINLDERKKPREKTKETEKSGPPHHWAKFTRDELIDEVVSAGQMHTGVVYRLCEIVRLPLHDTKEWMSEHAPDVSPAEMEKVIAVLKRAYQHGSHVTTIPATVLLEVLTIGIPAFLEEIAEVEQQRRGTGDTAAFDLRTFHIERRRRLELQALLAGMGAAENSHPFHPDAFQLEAVDLVVNQGIDAMVSAPTGSGKTWIAEQAIRRTLERGQSAWYTSPLKALSNDKFREFGEIFGTENVGLITGDRRINPDAPLRIATTEIYRNGLYDAMNGMELSSRFRETRLVVFDEVHYLGDMERGVVWEESIIYTPAEARILMLSATVGNAQELSDWVSWTRGIPCKLVFHPDRPVPLRMGFVHSNGRLQPLFTDQESTRLHPDIHNLYAQARHEQEIRQSHRRPFYRKRR